MDGGSKYFNETKTIVMPVNDQDLLLIESYIDNSISESDLKIFNSRMTDSSFSETVKTQKELVTSLQNNYQKELKDDMRKMLDDTHIDPNLYKGKKSIVIYGALFLLLAVIIASMFYFMKDTHKSSNQVFAEAFVPFPADNLQRGDVQVDVLLKNASLAYAQNNFEASQKYYKQIIELNPQNSRAKLFLANTYLSLNKAPKAIDVLTQLKREDDINFNYHVDWYLVLAHLANKDSASAKALINAKSSDAKHTYKKEFDDILAELK